MDPSDKPKKDTYQASIATGATVCKEIKMLGTITVGTLTIIHPKASILAENGPIVIGDGNIIEEQSVIVNKLPPGSDGQAQTLFIGNNNMFEVGSVCEAKAVGDSNVLEAKCYVGPEIEITNGCIIGAACRLKLAEKLPENVSICGAQHLRKTMLDKPAPQTSQKDYLARILPNYHHLKKPRNHPSNATPAVP